MKLAPNVNYTLVTGRSQSRRSVIASGTKQSPPHDLEIASAQKARLAMTQSDFGKALPSSKYVLTMTLASVIIIRACFRLKIPESHGVKWNVDGYTEENTRRRI